MCKINIGFREKKEKSFTNDKRIKYASSWDVQGTWSIQLINRGDTPIGYKYVSYKCKKNNLNETV